MPKPKLLVIDIETEPHEAYVWGLFNQFVGLSQIKKSGQILSWAAKHVGEKRTRYMDRRQGYKAMLKEMHRLLSECDAVVTYNGDSFDLKWLRGEFVKAGLPPLPLLTTIDVLKTVRKFRLASNKLAYVVKYFGIGEKIDTDFELWVRVMNNEPSGWKEIRRYNIHDTDLLEATYLFFRPHMDKHPAVGETGECPNCTSDKLQSRGYRRTRKFRIQRLHCQDCGAWSEGKREAIK